MSNFWRKVKIWTKGILIGLVVVYALVFLIMNTGQPPVELWFWYHTRLLISPLLLVFVMLVLGAVAALLVRATIHTITQIRESRERSRTHRLEREVADMKQKAGMVRTRDPDRPRPEQTQQD
jgi:uncharacterized integral membrane protein